MIACLDDAYFETLEKYVGKKLRIFTEEENRIEIYDDVEIQYLLEQKDNVYSLYIIERGKPSKEADFFSEKELKQQFALIMKGLFGEPPDYSNLKPFYDIKGFEDGKKLIMQYGDPQYYSIMKPEPMKINLEKEKDTYNIYFLNNKKEKAYIEKNADAPFALFRLYTASLSLKRHFKIRREYERVFEEKLENKEMYGLSLD